MSSDLRLVHGSDILETLQEQGEVVIHRYQINKPVFVLTLVIGAAILGLAGMMWWNGQVAGTGGIAGFTVLTLTGIGFGILATYWYSYTQTHFLALSPESLFLGGRDRMWSVGWSLLDRETLGFDNMTISSTGGALELDVADEHLQVRLYNTFVHVEDIQGFMFQILQHLKEDEEGEDDDESSESAEVDESASDND